MHSKFFKKTAIAVTAVMSLSCMASVVNSPAYMPVADTALTAYAIDSVKITSTVGYGEGMYATWSKVAGADGYNVYVDGVQIDSMLIREYKDYMRADALGLKAGSHTMKVVPVVSGKEDTSKASEAKADAYAHIREGFGFVNGTSSGAYNEDGTLKSNAVVIYVTNENKDTVTVTLPNKDGKDTQLVGVQNIITGLKSNKKVAPVAIRIIGNITDPETLIKGDLYIDTATCGLTVEGIGNDTTINGFGIVMKNSSNVEVRNLGFMNCDSTEGDDCGLQQGNNHVWVHNCDFFYGAAGSDADQVKGDGALDTKTSTYVTHSFNHFWDNGKCNLQGMKSESTENSVTYHHNWYDHSDSRHPRIRTCTVHSYNNYFDGNAKYGMGVTLGASAFLENNYFRNCKYPALISGQGSDVATGGTFSGENGGIIKAFGNYIEGAKAMISYSDDKTEFDAYVAKSRDEQVPSSVTCKKGGTTYNNFDTASNMYKYKADKAEDVPKIVTAKAGRVDGGDLQWKFNNAVDDESYAVNQALKDTLVAYKDSIVSIGSGSKTNSGTTPVATTTTTSKSGTQNTTTTTKAPTTPSTPATTPAGVKVEYSGGWNEMAYLGLSGIKDADVTGVSYSGASTGSLKSEDLEYLVRDVDGGVRVDLLGLKAGTYTITVTTSKGEIKQSGIVVGQQDRSGYAHYGYTDGVGAYNDNGELKANAKVIYVTEQNKNTVSVTSKDGTTVKGIGNILNSVGQDTGNGKNANGGTANTNKDIIKKLAKDGTPLVVRIVGNVSTPEGVTVFDSVDLGGSVGDNGGMARMRSGKNITIEGVGNDATVNGWGFHFMCESSEPELGKSFEVRNVAFRNVPEDCIGMEGVQEGSKITASVERCWIHNCEFYVPKIANPAESDKAEGDGACDFKRGQYFTNSYCYYEGYHKTNLVGASDSNLQFNISFHHNYWKKCESRGPLARQANIHLYNNIFDGQSSYCASARANSFLFSEYNAYVNECKDPVLLKSGGVFKSYNDAYISLKKGAKNEGTIVTDKKQKLDSACQKANFDTDSSLSYIPSGNYKLIESTGEALYTALTAEFEAYGGCMDNNKKSSNSGTTTPSDTTTTQKPSGSTTTTTTTKKGETTTTTVATVKPVTGGYVHDFTKNGKDSDFYTITGNLSTSKGTVNYNGLKLTQCLKLESATNIAFNAPSAGKITLVFAEANATIKIDGTKYTSSGDGTITVDLKAGAHTITKADTANLFYMVYGAESGNDGTTTTTTTKATTVTTTTTKKPDSTDIIYGDANGDGEVSLSDAVFIMQCLSNPDLFSMDDKQKDSADVCNRGDGVSTADALAIQKRGIGLIDSLPESYME